MNIPYKILNFTLIAETEIKLPDFKGSALRGGFGNILRKITCVLKRLDCTECALKLKCIYAYIFETPPDAQAEILNMNKYEKVPHPFVFEPPVTRKRIFSPDEEIQLKLILIGKATEYAPHFVFSISELGKAGIGKGRGNFRIKEVFSTNLREISLNDKSIYETTEHITIKAITPVRIKYNRDLVRKLEFHILIRSLLRRLSLLYYFHVKRQLPILDIKALIEKAEKIKIIKDGTYWYDWERYSSRQNSRMKLGGVVGEITYEGNIAPFMPYLRAGEILHVGKGTSFGLGKYEIII